MLKVLKFGGSSMADAAQFEKVRSIVTSDESRRVVVVSAAGKRYKDDHKVTDLLYLCYAHLQYGVSCDGIYQMICDRYLSIRDELGLRTDLEGEFAALRRKMDQGISQDELVSRGEYFAAKLMADYLGFDFLDSTMWLKFRLDGSVDQEASYEALQHAASGRRVVMPGFYGVMPDGAIKTFTRGGSDITGALAAAALDADVYENWTDVSGFLMADPRIVEDPQPIERITYSELRELSYIGAQVLHEGTIFPVREKNIPLNIRNTNQPDNPGTMIRESFDETEQLDHQDRHELGERLAAPHPRGARALRRQRRVSALRHRQRLARRLRREGRALHVSAARRAAEGDQARRHPRHGEHRHRRRRRP